MGNIFLMKQSIVVLSIVNGMAGWGCPIWFKIYWIGMAHCALWNAAAISHSVTEVTTCLRVLQSNIIATFR